MAGNQSVDPIYETNPMYSAWLQYRPIEDDTRLSLYREWCRHVVFLGHTPGSTIMRAAKRELSIGLQSMLKSEIAFSESAPATRHIAVGTLTVEDAKQEGLDAERFASLAADGYAIATTESGGASRVLIAGRNDAGTLYGVFHLLRLLNGGNFLEELSVYEASKNALRMLNHWDNMDGSIERGYAGKSIFYRDGHIVANLTRIRDYARLLASVGLNAISVNNVNVHSVETRLITDEVLPDVARLANVFREYGIRLFLSVNFASPIEIGGMNTADPVDPSVLGWWKERVQRIYRHIPDFGGVVVKADSEFRPGPFTYGRNHVDGANMFADALKDFGGVVVWRCFVYNCLQDWRDRSTDRARAAYDHFKPLDGGFRENVILQIKNGPMDFQVREPVSPLFGALTRTNQMLELQVTQEYTGQQKHLCYLVPQWKEVLEFDTFAKGEGSLVSRVADGSLFGRPIGGIAAVSNVGDDENWTGHPLAQANLYGYGRLAWNPDLSAEQITDEWISMTFAAKDSTRRVMSRILLSSWSVYESYTAPLGVGWMVNPGHHYGPNVDGYEYSKWGTYHFADCRGIGVDRTENTGTGYTAQYHSPHRERFESLSTCPDEFVLFFHHVPYTHRLHSGKTVIQHIYDSHFEGVEQAETLRLSWESLQGNIDETWYQATLRRLDVQVEHSKEWRDQINTYFYRKSGIPDEKDRTIY